ETDRWVVVTGGPGMGKSALLAAHGGRRSGAHHFIRRGAYDWDDPAKLVGSLVAQLEDGFPNLREPDADERRNGITILLRPPPCAGGATGPTTKSGGVASPRTRENPVPPQNRQIHTAAW